MNIRNKLLEYFPAFSHRNYQLFWTGQVISVIGTWMQNTALNWLVYLITGDEFKVGLMNAVQFTPIFLFTLFAGVIIERYPKRKLIIITQTIQAVLAFVLFILVLINRMDYPVILVIMFLIGTSQAFDNPARQAFVVEMVEGKEHLINAIALNSAAFNGARLIGPAFAGMMMAGLGPKWCFFLNALSFTAVIAGLFMMKIDDKASRSDVFEIEKGVFSRFTFAVSSICEGIKFIAKNPRLRYTFMGLIIIPTFCINFNILVPIFTKSVLGLGAKQNGILLSALGFGALVGALSVATKGKKDKASIFQLTGSVGLAISLIILGFLPELHFAAIMLALGGFFMIMFNTTSNTVLQLNAPDNMRGRIMSVFSLVVGGLAPFGSLYAGTVSRYLGANNTFKISGIIGMLGFLFLLSKRRELR